ncbi:MAG: hypothetical protein ACXABY_35455 [Candidatus Thorarchaeota archaeon]|jgi:hypothetical protein
MTISKYEDHAAFGNEIFAGMDSFLKENFAELEGSLDKTASQKEGTNTLAALTEELVKCAATLEDLEHPLAQKADAVLQYIAGGMLGLKKNIKKAG